MHGIRSNTHFLTFKSSTHHGISENNSSKVDESNQDLVEPVKKVKPTYGHTMADVEKQIIDWQNELKD